MIIDHMCIYILSNFLTSCKFYVRKKIFLVVSSVCFFPSYMEINCPKHQIGIAQWLRWGLCLPRWHNDQESACQCKRCRKCGLDPWFRRIPWHRKWQPTPVFLPRKFHGQGSLVGYSPWGSQRVGHDRAHIHIHMYLPQN